MPLVAIEPTWINAPVPGEGPTYDSEELRRTQGFMLASGATPDVTRTGVLDLRALLVTLNGNNVMINPGGAVIGTGKGAYLSGAAAAGIIDTLVPADDTNPRRDRVVMEILDPDNGGGAGRKAQFRVITGQPSATAASGGGYPAAPASPSITLFDVDVPKYGTGAPVLTDRRPYTAAAGAPIPVRGIAEAEATTKFFGRRVQRLDLPGMPYFTWDGARWTAPALGFLGDVTNGGETRTGLDQSALVVKTVATEPNRRIKVTARVTGQPDTAALYGEYKIFAGGVELETHLKRYSGVDLGESFEFEAYHGSGAGGNIEFSLQCRVVDPVATTGLIKSKAFNIKLTIKDDGNG